MLRHLRLVKVTFCWFYLIWGVYLMIVFCFLLLFGLGEENLWLVRNVLLGLLLVRLVF